MRKPYYIVKVHCRPSETAYQSSSKAWEIFKSVSRYNRTSLILIGYGYRKVLKES